MGQKKKGERLMPTVVGFEISRFRDFDKLNPQPSILNPADSLMRTAAQMPPPIDAFVLCQLAAYLLLTQISVIPVPELPPDIPAVAIRRAKGTFRILYRPAPRLLSTQLDILHELAHILLNHCRSTPSNLFSERCLYTDMEEQEAERLAHQMMALILSPPPGETAMVTRFFSLLPPTPEEATFPVDPRPGLRFEALLPELNKR
jgi:hypothetical protein